MPGLDKETRAVLGHHCSSLNGSEVVYSRQLQTRALRKLGLILKRVRMGLSLEDDAMRELGVISTPPPLTPRLAATMPVLSQPAAPSSHAQVAAAAGEIAVDAAVGAALELEELQSVKEEQLDLQTLEEAADRLTLFPVELVSLLVSLRLSRHLAVTVTVVVHLLTALQAVQRSLDLRVCVIVKMCLPTLTTLDTTRAAFCTAAS